MVKALAGIFPPSGTLLHPEKIYHVLVVVTHVLITTSYLTGVGFGTVTGVPQFSS
jgi:hypothetical protein